MKTCPYCAEEIQDAAIKCRYCQSWLVDEVPASAERPPAAVVQEPASTAPAVSFEPAPAEEPVVAEPEAASPPWEPAVEEPAAEAEQPAAAASGAVLPTMVASSTTPEPVATVPTAVPQAAPDAVTPPTAVETPKPESRVEFTHSGERYLLGYTDDFFGIWDRQAPTVPVERFPRTDDGWRQVWQRYAGIETNWMDLRTGQRSP